MDVTYVLPLSVSLPPSAWLILRLLKVFCQKFVLGLCPKLLLTSLILTFQGSSLQAIWSSQAVTLRHNVPLHSHSLLGLLIGFQGIFIHKKFRNIYVPSASYRCHIFTFNDASCNTIPSISHFIFQLKYKTWKFVFGYSLVITLLCCVIVV